MKDNLAFRLKKDLPTISAGNLIILSDDGQFGSPALMEIEKRNCILYMFPIEIMKNNPEWFEECERRLTGMPVYE